MKEKQEGLIYFSDFLKEDNTIKMLPLNKTIQQIKSAIKNKEKIIVVKDIENSYIANQFALIIPSLGNDKHLLEIQNLTDIKKYNESTSIQVKQKIEEFNKKNKKPLEEFIRTTLESLIKEATRLGEQNIEEARKKERKEKKESDTIKSILEKISADAKLIEEKNAKAKLVEEEKILKEMAREYLSDIAKKTTEILVKKQIQEQKILSQEEAPYLDKKSLNLQKITYKEIEENAPQIIKFEENIVNQVTSAIQNILKNQKKITETNKDISKEAIKAAIDQSTILIYKTIFQTQLCDKILSKFIEQQQDKNKLSLEVQNKIIDQLLAVDYEKLAQTFIDGCNFQDQEFNFESYNDAQINGILGAINFQE